MSDDTPTTRQEWAELLQRRINEAELGAEDFAERVLFRDGRTIWRWLKGESPVPLPVRTFLLKPKRSPYPRRAR